MVDFSNSDVNVPRPPVPLLLLPLRPQLLHLRHHALVLRRQLRVQPQRRLQLTLQLRHRLLDPRLVRAVARPQGLRRLLRLLGLAAQLRQVFLVGLLLQLELRERDLQLLLRIGARCDSLLQALLRPAEPLRLLVRRCVPRLQLLVLRAQLFVACVRRRQRLLHVRLQPPHLPHALRDLLVRLPLHARHQLLRLQRRRARRLLQPRHLRRLRGHLRLQVVDALPQRVEGAHLLAQVFRTRRLPLQLPPQRLRLRAQLGDEGRLGDGRRDGGGGVDRRRRCRRRSAALQRRHLLPQRLLLTHVALRRLLRHRALRRKRRARLRQRQPLPLVVAGRTPHAVQRHQLRVPAAARLVPLPLLLLLLH
eukprot:Rhum_TRINITY_DN14237_c2_g1::Rhum_TRINITY_DN14237_c2_g1_i1::g.75168::m.75168